MFRTGRLGRWGAALRGREEAARAEAEASSAFLVRRSPAGPTLADLWVRGAGGQTEVRRRQCRLDGDPEAVRTARTLVADALRAWGRADLVDDATLVVSELVTNALVHGSPPVTIAVADESGPVVEVSDAGRDLPVKRLPGSAGHFGVWLADELCDLHVRLHPAGKTIRADFCTR